jgi:hypothetical protein
MPRCRAKAADKAHDWLVKQIADDFRGYKDARVPAQLPSREQEPRGDLERAGALVEAAEAVCGMPGYSGEPLYVVASNDAVTLADGTASAAAHMSEYMLIATTEGVNNAVAKAGAEGGAGGEERGWNGQLGKGYTSRIQLTPIA